MVALDVIEALRLEIQSRIDSTKTQTERNKLGQFATPTALASEILEYAKSILPSGIKIRFLDPAFGTGAFYSALLRTFSLSQIEKAEAYEIDADYGLRAKELWNDTPLKLTIADFTKIDPPRRENEKANLLICNPPYVRHHHLSEEEKSRLRSITEQITGKKLSGLSGLYCYFLCLSHGWLAKNGLAGWLIPSEFMDVNYGNEIKEYLLQNVTLLRVHRFSPRDVQFGDALVSSAVVWFKNEAPSADHTVEFTYGGTLLRPNLRRLVSVEELHNITKWSNIDLNDFCFEHTKNRATLSDFFYIKRGLATGANEFFILTKEQVLKNNLPSEFLLPILPSPRFLPVDEIEADNHGNPILDRQLFLLECNLPENEVKDKFPTLFKYIQNGVEKGFSERYLCRHRSPWYSQENRPPSPLLCTYMGRGSGGSKKPFRFILNHSRATAPNTYLLLYPKPILENNMLLLKSIWKILNELPVELITRNGRIYGGGLYKLEPKELGNVPADDILKVTGSPKRS